MDAPYYGLSPFLLPFTTLPYCDAVRAARDDLIAQRDSIERRIASANAFLNSTVHVNRLPTELLVMVFFHVRDSHDPNHPWHNVTAVCRAWRATATSQPRLWTDVRVNQHMNPLLFQASLERSLLIPIAVSFSPTTDLKLYLPLLREHLVRVRVLNLDATPLSQAGSVASLLNESFPTLEELSAFLDPRLYYAEEESNDDYEMFAWSPQDTRLPRLKSLSLRGVALGVTTTFGPLVKRLELRDCVGPDTYYATALTDVLRRCVGLEELIVHHYRCNYAWHVGNTGTAPRFALPPTLRTFVLDGADWIVSEVLSVLHVPATAEIRITRRIRDSDSSPPPLDGESLLAGLPILSMVSRARYSVQGFGKSCTMTGTGTGLPKVTLISHDPARERYETDIDVPDLIAVFGHAPLVDLAIVNAGRDYSSTKGWKRMLGQFPLLHRLAFIMTIWPGFDARYPFLNALRPWDAEALLCPDLRELVLSLHTIRHDPDPIFMSDVKKCLEKRLARGQRLEKLRLGLHNAAPSEDEPLANWAPARRRREAYCREIVGSLADVVEYKDSEEYRSNDFV